MFCILVFGFFFLGWIIIIFLGVDFFKFILFVLWRDIRVFRFFFLRFFFCKDCNIIVDIRFCFWSKVDCWLRVVWSSNLMDLILGFFVVSFGELLIVLLVLIFFLFFGFVVGEILRFLLFFVIVLLINNVEGFFFLLFGFLVFSVWWLVFFLLFFFFVLVLILRFFRINVGELKFIFLYFFFWIFVIDFFFFFGRFVFIIVVSWICWSISEFFLCFLEIMGFFEDVIELFFILVNFFFFRGWFYCFNVSGNLDDIVFFDKFWL